MTTNRTYFRPARESDEATVLRFTSNTFQHGDYIGQVWKDWLNDPHGKLLAATINRQPVAVAHVAVLSPNEAWLEGLRVDPAYRRSGLATKMIHYCLKNAIQRGAGIMRFITSSENLAVHTIAANFGFQKTVSLRSFQSPPIPGSLTAPLKATPPDLPCLLNFTSGSQMRREMNGLFGSGWQYSALTGTLLESKIRAGRVLMIRTAAQIQAAAVIEKRLHDNNLVICYADGSQAALKNLLTRILEHAPAEKSDMVSVRLPENSSVVAVFKAAGFQPAPEETFWIFEKSLLDQPQKSQ